MIIGVVIGVVVGLCILYSVRTASRRPIGSRRTGSRRTHGSVSVGLNGRPRVRFYRRLF